jgi:(S)-3,5-dihydroxyphenylglycine transaminase
MLIQQPEKLNAACLDVMNFLNEVTLWYPSAISFAPGRPAEQFFDVRHGLDKLSSYVAYVAKNSGQSPATAFNQLGQYQKTNGIINDLVCRFLERDEGIHTTAGAIMITDGCQEAMTILLAGLFNPAKDVLLVIDPTYTGITGIASVLGTALFSVPSEKDDIDLDALAASIHQIQAQGKNPRALYVTPDFNNPLGTSMTLEDRKRLLDLARASGILIIEDNAYGMFAYDSEHMPTLKALDTDGVVVYLGTFSKLLFPALRVGFLVADQRVLHDDSAEICCLAEELSKVKSFTTVSTSALLQAIVGGILLEAECSLHETIQDKIAFYRTNRDLMLKYLEQHFGRDPLLAEKVSWNHPHGGFFLTVNLPFAFTKDAMRTCAENYGVICCPMSFFSLLGRCEKQVRLSFSYVSPHEIERGVLQFWKFVHNYAIMGQ